VRRFAVAAWLSLVAAGCSDPPASGAPCDLDALGCDTSRVFRLDADCSSEGELDVALGQGRAEFDDLEPAEAPELHYGSQGGQHLFVSLRVMNPDPEHDLYQVFLAFQRDEGEWADVTEREIVFSGRDAASPGDSGVELAGLVLQLPNNAPGSFRLVLDVRDSCDRRGRAEHPFAW
jgi:hypothetical protein